MTAFTFNMKNKLIIPCCPARSAKLEVQSARFSVRPSHFSLVAGLLLLCGAVWEVSAGTETKNVLPKTKTESNTPPREVVTPKSVFIDDPQFGKDPFFPGSTRRAPKMVGRINALVDPLNLPLNVKLIIVGQNKKLAQINNRSFEQGEQAEVLVGAQKVKLRCLEIREKSVLVNVEGINEPKELFLRQ